MNPLPPWYHGFFKSPIAFGQRRRQGNHVLHVHALSGKQHDFMAQACGFEAVVRYQHNTPCPAARFFPPAWRPKYRANRGPNRRTARPARQGRSRTAAGAKMLPVSPCPPDNSVGYLFKSPAVSPTFAASAMISPSSGLSIKIAIFCIAVKFSGRRFS